MAVYIFGIEKLSHGPNMTDLQISLLLNWTWLCGKGSLASDNPVTQ